MSRRMLGGGPPRARRPIKSKNRMTLLANSLSLGETGFLVGEATGELVGVFRRVAAGANGLIAMGDLTLYQASGPEFDGAFQWVSLGSTPAVSWGAPGSESTGGILAPAGSIALGGLRGISGLRRDISATWKVDALPPSPQVHDSLICGASRRGGSPRLLYGGGVGYGSGLKIRGAICLGDDPVSYTIDVSADAEGVFSGPARALTHYSMHKRGSSANIAGYCGAWTGLDSAADGGDSVRIANNLTPVEADFLDYEITISSKGAWTARCVSVIADFGV